MPLARLLSVILVLSPLVSAAAAADSAPDPVFPVSWEGIWMVTRAIVDCDTGEIVDEDAAPDTICAGETMAFTVEGVEITCSGTITDDTVDAVCTGQTTVFPGCTASVTSDVGGTRTGDSYEIDQRVLVDLSPLCFTADRCFRATFSGVRIAGGQGVCAPISTVDPLSWGVIKARYAVPGRLPGSD